MTESLKIGLTGGIASGKSTVCDLFKELSIEVIDADEISHELSKSGGDAFQEIVDFFGDEIINHDGELDRGRLRTIVFNDHSKKETLEKIIHPKVLAQINEQITAALSKYLIISVPLMIETGMNMMMDRILLIDCNTETQIKRLIARDNSTKQEALTIIASQTSIDVKREFADDIIINDSETSIDELRTQVTELDNFYSNLSYK